MTTHCTENLGDARPTVLYLLHAEIRVKRLQIVYMAPFTVAITPSNMGLLEGMGWQPRAESLGPGKRIDGGRLLGLAIADGVHWSTRHSGRQIIPYVLQEICVPAS